MEKRIRGGLSFANVIALLALFIALGGTVYAASKIDGKTIEKASMPGNRVKPDSLKGKQIKEAKLAEVPKADHANSADAADSAQPVAFAYVNADGTVDGSLSKGVSSANITHPNTGTYCVSDVSFEIRGGQVTPYFGGSRGTTAQFTPSPTGNCPNGGQILLSDNTNAAADLAFNLLIYG
jgi:hypothetical protein